MDHFRRRVFSANTTVFSVSLLISYLLFEGAVYIAILLGVPFINHPYWNLSAWTTPFATYDPVIGYCLKAGTANGGLRIIDGRLQFHYSDVRANAQGFRSNFDYAVKKRATHRIVVYGDSFTAGLYQPHAWTETLQTELNARAKTHGAQGDGFAEVYNFSFDGGGVFNWHRHYFQELKPNYDFDLVVFAVCCNDLKRGLATYHADKQSGVVFYGKFNGSTETSEQFKRTFLPRMYAVLELRGVDELAAYAKLTLYLTFRWVKRRLGLNLPVTAAEPTSKATTTGAPADTFSVRRDYTDMMLEMLEDIRARGKQVLLVTIPSDRSRLFRRFPRVRAKPHTTFPADVEDVRAIADRHCLPYVNGYDIFDAADAEAMKTFWPSLDGHWLTPGSDYFARALTPQIESLLAGGMRSAIDRRAATKILFSGPRSMR